MKMKGVTSFISVILFVGSAYAQPATSSDIDTPQKRATSVELAARLLAPPSTEEIQVPDGLRNPFDPAIEAKIEMKSGRPASDKELLALLADQLHPTGVMGREDALVLLLKGQKGVKLNDKLTLSFDGVAYEVEITAVDHNSFSLRFNQAEITRPIK
jgi:hypothetical protein